MRDYLYHAYNVQTLSIRSMIRLGRLDQRMPEGRVKRWYRYPSTKKMTVELVHPFVWPERKSEDELKAFHKETYKQADEAQEEFGRQRGEMADALVDREERKAIKKEARALLEGEEEWLPYGGLRFGRSGYKEDA